MLSSPVGDVILLEPNITDVIIIANDNPNGVLGFRSTNLLTPPTVLIDEDTNSEQAEAVFTVVRSDGFFGSISVGWEVVRGDSMPGAVAEDLNPTSGTVNFAEGEREKSIIINIIDDSLSEATEMFVVHLLPNTSTGGAKVDGIIQGEIIIKDSDNIYGIVEFANEQRQLLIIVSILILVMQCEKQGCNVFQNNRF